MSAGAPFAVSEEQQALRSAVADLMTHHSSETQVRTQMATDTGLDPTVWRELAAMGLTGLLIDERHGGAGAGPVEMAIAMEEMGRALLVSPFLSTAVLVPSLLIGSGDAAECAAVLPRIAAGDLIATAAFAEDGSARLPATIASSAGLIATPGTSPATSTSCSTDWPRNWSTCWPKPTRVQRFSPSTPVPRVWPSRR